MLDFIDWCLHIEWALLPWNKLLVRSWCVILCIYCWILLANSLLKIFWTGCPLLTSIILHTQEANIRSVSVQSHPGPIVHETLSQKYVVQNRAGRVIHMVKCLPSQCEALSTNPSTIKKKFFLYLYSWRMLFCIFIFWLWYQVSINSIKWIEKYSHPLVSSVRDCLELVV
jgi:hypothetical protein